VHDLIIRAGTVVDGTGGPPTTADIAISGGRIAEIGRVEGPGRRTIVAPGAIVAPGWIDIHTHYDGQVAWDSELVGSAANGVTTVVMGNCGVGFAPVRTGQHDAMIDLMEGVEDIPGTALYEGVPWGAWQSFPEYLDFLDGRQWSVDVAAQLPHGPLRYFVMGDHALDDKAADESELQRMASVVQEAMAAGAVGFSTSRIQQHRATSGRTVPGTSAPEAELRALAHAMSHVGRRVFQGIAADSISKKPTLPPEHSDLFDEVAMFSRLSRETRLPVVFTLMQNADEPERWRQVLELVAHENSTGSELRPCVAARGQSMLSCLEGYHMFMRRPSYLQARHLDATGQAAFLRDPRVRSRILAESDVVNDELDAVGNVIVSVLGRNLDRTFPQRSSVDYEPTADQSVARIAQLAGRAAEEVMYDLLVEDDGRGMGQFLISNYVDGDLDACREMLTDPHTVTGLSDAGAHVRFVCDMSLPTFHLSHWVRGRTRGATIPLERAVAKQTAVNARLYGFDDRGVLAVGRRADVNVIDLDRLRIEPPVMVRDLPAGGRRLLQTATGYVATAVAGVLTREHDQDTGERPGRLVRAR
jgi:N-acyl-D-aspartate/D-glutamate deacylase